MAYILKTFDVQSMLNIKGIAQFRKEPEVYELSIILDDGNNDLVHMDDLANHYTFNRIEFIDAKAEKILYDNGRLK